jgi:hypothetical protein
MSDGDYRRLVVHHIKQPHKDSKEFTLLNDMKWLREVVLPDIEDTKQIRYIVKEQDILFYHERDLAIVRCRNIANNIIYMIMNIPAYDSDTVHSLLDILTRQYVPDIVDAYRGIEHWTPTYGYKFINVINQAKSSQANPVKDKLFEQVIIKLREEIYGILCMRYSGEKKTEEFNLHVVNEQLADTSVW